MLWSLPPQVCTVSYFVCMSEVIREHNCTSSSTGELGLPLPGLGRLLIPRQMVLRWLVSVWMCCGGVALSKACLPRSLTFL